MWLSPLCSATVGKVLTHKIGVWIQYAYMLSDPALVIALAPPHQNAVEQKTLRSNYLYFC
jgi:hypothetical protein